MPLHALLIAVENYHPDSNVIPLAGCRNDVAAMRAFMLKYLKGQIRHESDIRTLENETATRSNVIQAWQEHLGHLGPDDTALVYFSGHGSRSKTADAFLPMELDGWEEGWVLYDSRAPDGYDLADKEIALLIQNISRNNPDIVVITDACHSGSVTRNAEEFMGWKTRYTPGSQEPRPLHSYLGGAFVNQLERGQTLQVPHARHLSISACKNTEKAFESSEKYGVFSQALRTTAEAAAVQITYSDLFTRTCATIRRFTRMQNPQIAAFGGFNPHRGFLGNPLPPKNQRRYLVYFDPAPDRWKIKLGADTGLRSDMNQPLNIALFDAPANGNCIGTTALAQLNVAESSLNAGNAKLNRYEMYWGVPLAMPLPPFCVYCPEKHVAGPVQAELEKQGEGSILLLDQPQGCPVELRAAQTQFSLHQTHNGQQITTTTAPYPAEADAQLLRYLDQLAHWHRILELKNPDTRLPTEKVPLQLSIRDQNGNWGLLDGEDFTLSFEQHRIPFKISASNESGHNLHMALVYLSPHYGMSVLPGTSISPMPGNTVDYPLLEQTFFLPDTVDEEYDHFKLIVSTEPIDSTAFSREDLEPDGSLSKSILPTTRSISALVESDWFVKSIRVRLLRNAEGGDIGERPVILAGGQLTLEAHTKLHSPYQITAPALLRSLDAVDLNHPFFQESPRAQLLPLTPGKPAQQTNYLDLTNIQQSATLAHQPWNIALKPDDSDSLILPFWFDGSNFLPIGETIARDDGSLVVQVRHIPTENQTARTRSLGKALRLYAFKFAKDKGLPVATRHLRWVSFGPDGSVEQKTAGLAAQVQNAQKIILLIHGIAGDTRTMAPAFRQWARQNGGLVLCFDYENLNTPLEDTALALKTLLLEEAGLGNKKITIAAHSIGGLLARYFIEKLGGHTLVEQLTMAGTPNAGSRLGNIPDYLNWASGMLGIGLKYFQWNLPALAGLIGALQFARNELLVTLDQLKPGSKFLTHLNAGAPPPVPYHVVAGDIRQFLSGENDPDFSEKLLAQLGRWAYSKEPNDGAVSIESICAVEAVSKAVVPGHHWGYFSGAVNF